MQLYIVVTDYDPLFGNDFIDKVAADFTVTSLDSLSTEISYTGAQGSLFTIGKTLTCSTNYYGTLCATYCLAQDSDQNGHYTCNTADGSFNCRNGYTGSDCKTREFVIVKHVNSDVFKLDFLLFSYLYYWLSEWRLHYTIHLRVSITYFLEILFVFRNSLSNNTIVF